MWLVMASGIPSSVLFLTDHFTISYLSLQLNCTANIFKPIVVVIAEMAIIGSHSASFRKRGCIWALINPISVWMTIICASSIEFVERDIDFHNPLRISSMYRSLHNHSSKFEIPDECMAPPRDFAALPFPQWFFRPALSSQPMVLLATKLWFLGQCSNIWGFYSAANLLCSPLLCFRHWERMQSDIDSLRSNRSEQPSELSLKCKFLKDNTE